jgi:AcrR family transcriptional regulator
VGTLYQYFPDKAGVLYAVLESFLVKVEQSLKDACESVHGEPVERMAAVMVEAFVEAKMRKKEASEALYRIGVTVEVTPLLKDLRQRSVGSIARMLATVPVVALNDVTAVAETVYGAMVGATRMVLEAGATPKMVRQLKEQLVVLCAAYLGAACGLISGVLEADSARQI